MTDYEILDCTLRDGGYYTDWDFDEELVETYLANVARLPVSAIEIGYCSKPLPGYKGQWFYLDKEKLSAVKATLRPDQRLGIMLDAKDNTPEMIPELLGDLVGVIDLVRMAVAPNQFTHGIALARELKKLGFLVGFNTMYLSTYGDDLAELAPLKEGVDVIDVLALVDSFGGCAPTQVSQMIAKTVKMFPDTIIGFHGHDNTCMAYANALAALDAGAKIVDSTFVGMGRGAGNTRTEMMLVHKAGGTDDVDFDAVANIVEPFEKLRDTYGWGANLPYMLSGAANLPQKDVMDWLGKNRYSPVSVVRALKKQSNAPLDNRVFQDMTLDSFPVENGVLIIGGGSSVTRHRKAICDYVARSQPLAIHSSTRHLDLVPQLGPNQLVCLAGHAAARLPDDLSYGEIAGFVAPPPPRFPGTVPDGINAPVYQAAPYPAADNLGPVSDIGPLSLALGAAKALGAKQIYLVGFDGYPNATVSEQELGSEIQRSLDTLRADGGVKIFSLTPTLYDLPTQSIYAKELAS